MRILVCTDKFKGSLSAYEACKAIETGINQQHPNAQTLLVPMADGGEGSLQALSRVLDLKSQSLMVSGPLFDSTECAYGYFGDVAHIEMAQASGLSLLLEKERNPLYTSSLGTGQLMAHAIANGAKKISLWVGGSATNDGGIGLAQALGFKFFNSQGRQLSPIGKNLASINAIEPPKHLSNTNIEVLTDVNNRLVGEQGAAYVFAAQKGALPEDIALLDDGLKNLADRLYLHTGKDVRNIAGMGAAGGVATVIASYMNVSIRSGIERLLDLYRFKDLLKKADLVITGEGKVDNQTLQGKVVQGIAHQARHAKIPVWVFCGHKSIGSEALSGLGVEKVVSLQNLGHSQQYCIDHAAELLSILTAQTLKSAKTT